MASNSIRAFTGSVLVIQTPWLCALLPHRRPFSMCHTFVPACVHDGPSVEAPSADASAPPASSGRSIATVELDADVGARSKLSSNVVVMTFCDGRNAGVAGISRVALEP